MYKKNIQIYIHLDGVCTEGVWYNEKNADFNVI